MSPRRWIGISAVMAALAVAAGAFGAHALRGRVPDDLLAVFDTAARYHLMHAIGLVAVAVAVERGVKGAATAGWCLLAGTIIFSGSLYLLVTTGIRQLGAITPVGGIALIIGWTMLAVQCLRPTSSSDMAR